MYAIINKGRYVKDSRYGGNSSYTMDVQHAQKFETEEEALKNKCGDESIRKLSVGWI